MRCPPRDSARLLLSWVPPVSLVSAHRDRDTEKDSDVPIHRAINFHASSAWLSVLDLDLEAQGPRRRRHSPCLCHLSEVVGGQISAHPRLHSLEGLFKPKRVRRILSLRRIEEYQQLECSHAVLHLVPDGIGSRLRTVYVTYSWS